MRKEQIGRRILIRKLTVVERRMVQLNERQARRK
jgi:hypothetical protein